MPDPIIPVGDPTVWGGTVSTLLDDDPVLGANRDRIVNGGQILMAQAADRYSRSWTIVGNLNVSRNGFASGTFSGVPPSPREAVEGPDPFTAWLEITQGVGQVAITQLVLISVGGGDPGGGAGLAHDQFVRSGGPYGEQYTAFDGLGNPIAISRSFACVGAWIGNTISVRAIYTRSTLGFPAVSIGFAQMQLLMTPYAPGAGL